MEQFREAARIQTSEDASTLRPKLKTTLSLLSPATGEYTPVPDANLGTLPFDWSPDGTRLLVGRVDPVLNALDLYTWNRVSGAWVRVRRGPVGNGAGIADGPIRLVWHGLLREANKKYSGAIWIEVDAEGERVLPGSKGGAEPDVSSAGRSVVFTRAERESSLGPTIFMQALGDAEPRPVTRGSHPRFSRDGKWITFARKSEGNWDVWIMRADGSAKRPITKTAYDEEFPSLSADGRFVVYASSRGDDKESLLYVARVGDGAEREVVHSGLNSRPVW
jgi:dipeptidyl aminopeptidase/acylaminoacyl peptidase